MRGRPTMVSYAAEEHCAQLVSGDKVELNAAVVRGARVERGMFLQLVLGLE